MSRFQAIKNTGHVKMCQSALAAINFVAGPVPSGDKWPPFFVASLLLRLEHAHCTEVVLNRTTLGKIERLDHG